MNNTLEVWFDFACPWCFLGKRYLSIALEDLDESEHPKIIWRTFQLDANIPDDGIDLDEYFVKRGISSEMLQEGHQRLEIMGEEAGIMYRFDRMRVRSNTLNAHRLVVACDDAGLDSSRVIDTIFSASFERGIDIGDFSLLEEILKTADFDPALVDTALAIAKTEDTLGIVSEDMQMAQQAGITGVPAYVVNRAVMSQGAAPAPSLLALLERAKELQDS